MPIHTNHGLLISISDIIIALEHFKYSATIELYFQSLFNDEDNPNKIRLFACKEYYISKSLDMPITNEITSKVYSLLYSKDQDKLDHKKYDLTNKQLAKRARNELREIFPQILMHSIRQRFSAHRDYNHESFKGKGNVMNIDDIELQISSVLKLGNIPKIIELLTIIYNEMLFEGYNGDLIQGQEDVKLFWIRYAKGVACDMKTPKGKRFDLTQVFEGL